MRLFPGWLVVKDCGLRNGAPSGKTAQAVARIDRAES
jgi:hypothetical protein